MAVFIEVETDPFETNVGMAAIAHDDGSWLEGVAVRRPLRGLQSKVPTYSYLKIVTRFGQVIPLFDSGVVGADTLLAQTFSNYLLQSISISRSERAQVVATFGDNFLFLYGENPIQAAITGALVTSADFTWPQEFWFNYDEFMRGTKLADMGARLYLYVDGILIEGIPIAFSDSRTADQPHLVPFNMNLYVTAVRYLDAISNRFPTRVQEVGSVEMTTQPDGIDQPETLALDEGIESRNAMLSTRQAQLDNAQGAQLRQWQQSDAIIGSSWESARNEPGSPLRFSGPVTPDSFNRLDPRPSSSGERVTRSLPLRGLISDNYDEYLVRPTRPPLMNPDDQGSLTTGEGAEEAGIHEEDPLEVTNVTDYVDQPFDAPDEVIPTDAVGAETTLPEAIGYPSPDAEPEFGSGMVSDRIPTASELA